ncbi:SubName: Full=Related to kinesin light chain {ECO:0000313/EMBL:CCA74635.1} [Serendipita indica DSM 11827]|nr:SubName: Full=Related to kinesin light chain {ECO:0000313/EMBL:CCA74635.1} [Serendipita indica DSM 11827]
MSSFRSRLTSFFNASKSSSWTDLEGSVAGNSDGNDQSALKIRSKKEELGFLELVPGIDPVVDIIAIHGLDGHREKTWMAENGTLWLRDLLPADLPNVRVLAYGYDADTRSRECVSTQTIYQQADKFVKSLTRERSNAPRRPIIFVAHSLGGIVLKQAIILCHNQTLNSTNKLRDILVSTHAVLFFGTPHSGVKGADLLEVLNRLLSVYMKTTNVILQHLKENSPELENIQGLYISASEKIHTVFFYEIVPRHSAILAGDRQATEEGLYADHCEMVKFPDKYHGDYKTVLSYLKQYIQGAIAAVTDQWSAEDAHRVVARGYNPQNAIQPKARPSVSRSYVEREQIQSLITQKLLPHGDLQNQPRCVLYGLGGAGKTQLAAKWIREHESSFTRIICVDASSQTQLEADLEQSIRSLGPEYSAMTWEDAVAYLDDKEKGWLLFVDNADSPILELSLYLPTSIHGTILIASRNSECASYAPDSAVSVGSLEKSEAVKLLHSVANIAPTSDTESLQIAEELGMFALAITQAGAYIRKTRRLDKYLDTFRVHRKQLLSKGPDIGKEYTSSTYAAFNLSFNDLPKNAQEVLKLCAFLYHSSIPVSLFEISAKSGFSTYTVRKGCPPPESDITLISSIQGVLGVNWDPVVFQQLVELAARASFIEASTDGLFYNVHPLLQMYIRDCINEEGDERYARMAAQLLLGAIRPSEGGNAQLWQLLPHVNNIPRSIQSESVAHALAFFELYDSLGDWKACQELLEPTLAQVQQNRGENDEDVIWLKAQLASALQSLGEVERAERIQREVLDLQIKTIGPHHTDTISAMSDLAVTLSESGKLDEAEEIQREVLARRLDTLGKRHPDTIWAMSNLASTLSDRELLDEAETIEREVLALQLDVLGPRHPDTLSAMSNLGKTLSSIGRLDEAEKIQRDVLSLRLEVLGPRHPHTVSAMNNLANTLSDSGQFDEAVKLQREVLTLRLSLLGPRHLDTVWAMSNLGSILSECGRLDEAEKLERNVLALRLDILGSHHPDTITAMNNLASTLSDQGHLVETEKMKREILALQVETLGPRHADTISAMGSLASTLSDRGQLKAG